MKMNPPASSNSPTSRKKPRIIRHLISLAPERTQPLTVQQGKFNLISTLSAFSRSAFRSRRSRWALTLRGLHSIRPAMAAGAIPPPLFFEHRRCPFKNRLLSIGSGAAISRDTRPPKSAPPKMPPPTIINKPRRTQMRGSVRTVEEAIKRGDRDAALKAMTQAEPELMKAAQCNIIHKKDR